MILLSNFMTPRAFALLGLIPLLVLLYLLKLRRSEVIIPSTMLWMKSLQDLTANAPFQKLRRNLLLLLQILILLLLVFALSRPFVESSGMGGRNLCLLVDHSASMQTEEEDGTRLALAQEEALKIVDTMERGDKAMVIGFAASADVRCELTDDRYHLRNAIRSIEAHDTRSDVKDAAQIIRSLAPANPDVTAVVNNLEVLLFSDGRIDEGERLAALSLPLKYIKVGERRDNLGLTRFSIRNTDTADDERQCFVQVYNDSAEPVETTLSLYFGEHLLGVDELSIPAEDTDEAIFVLPELEEGVLRAELDWSDALALDNKAWLSLKPETSIDVLLVGAPDSVGLSLLRHVFSLDPRVKLAVGTPEQFTPNDDVELYIFDGWSPETLPEGSLVFVNTLPAINGLELLGELPNPPVMAVDKEHTVMRYTNPGNISIGKALQVALPTGATTLISTEGGPLVADISGALQPMLLIAFDIGDSNWPLHLSFPLFMQNVLAWLPSSGAAGESSLTTGSPLEIYALPDALDAQILAPGGEETSLSLDPLRPVYFADTKVAGPYTVSRGDVVDHFAVNLLNTNESAIKPAENLSMGSQQLAAVQGPISYDRELSRWLLAGGLAILALEWWVYTCRAEY
jgi:Ca-activated chloride channel homolog